MNDPPLLLLAEKLNANPTVFTSTVRRRDETLDDLRNDDGTPEAIDALEVFGACGGDVRGGARVAAGARRHHGRVRAPARHPAAARPAHRAAPRLSPAEAIRHLNDPEHPLTLEQLNVTTIDGVTVDNERSTGARRRGTGARRSRRPCSGWRATEPG